MNSAIFFFSNRRKDSFLPDDSQEGAVRRPSGGYERDNLAIIFEECKKIDYNIASECCRGRNRDRMVKSEPRGLVFRMCFMII